MLRGRSPYAAQTLTQQANRPKSTIISHQNPMQSKGHPQSLAQNLLAVQNDIHCSRYHPLQNGTVNSYSDYVCHFMARANYVARKTNMTTISCSIDPYLVG